MATPSPTDWTWIINIPAVGLLIAAIGWWLKKRDQEIKEDMAKKMDADLCKEREENITARLKVGDNNFEQIMTAIEQQRESIDAMQDQYHESTRLLGDCLLVICEAVGGNGTCERVQKLLDIQSRARLIGRK